MSFLFGGGKSKSENKAFPWLQSTYGGTSTALINQGQEGLNRVQDFISGKDTSGFDQYRRSAGYQNIFDEAMRGVTSNAAARGLLSSGPTLRATQDHAGRLAQQAYENYLAQLSGAASQQMNAGQGLASIISGAGGVSTSSQQGGLLGGLGALGQGIGAIAGGFRGR